jgi:hypothetical protein
MKLSKIYLTERLQDTSVELLAREIFADMYTNYNGAPVDQDKTIAKFEAMLRPLAPKTIKATTFAEALGIEVIEVN